MKETAKMWKCKLEHEIKDYTSCKMTPETLKMSKTLGKTWLIYDDICKRVGDNNEHTEEENPGAPVYRLTDQEIQTWNDNMLNTDGSKGGHWTEDQTTNLANQVGVYFEHITTAEWNVACNMIYSDYYMAARDAGADDAIFYGNMAKAFLFDRDGPGPAKKLCAYYHYIAKK